MKQNLDKKTSNTSALKLNLIHIFFLTTKIPSIHHLFYKKKPSCPWEKSTVNCKWKKEKKRKKKVQNKT